jgi:hypothetical protein
VIEPFVQAFPTSALRKEREGQGTHCVGDCQRDQKPGPPSQHLTIKDIGPPLSWDTTDIPILQQELFQTNPNSQ